MRLGVAFSVTTPSPPTVDEDLVIIGTTGSRPAAASGYAGRQFYATDTGLVYVCVPDGLGGYQWLTVGPSGGVDRVVALDANDIAEWALDDAAEPWADGVGSLDLTGYGGLGSYAPAVSVGGSIQGDRSIFCDWNSDTGLRSDTTTVGEVAAGTVHGWALLTAEQGTIFAKDEGSSIYLRTASNGPAASYELVAKIGDSGDVSVAPTRYRALVHSGAWTHFAMTWAGGAAYVYVNGVKLPTALSYTSITWGAGRWRLGKCDGLGSLSGLMSSWRVCNVARSAAYIDEVYKRAVGLYP